MVVRAQTKPLGRDRAGMPLAPVLVPKRKGVLLKLQTVHRVPARWLVVPALATLALAGCGSSNETNGATASGPAATSTTASTAMTEGSTGTTPASGTRDPREGERVAKQLVALEQPPLPGGRCGATPWQAQSQQLAVGVLGGVQSTCAEGGTANITILEDEATANGYLEDLHSADAGEKPIAAPDGAPASARCSVLRELGVTVYECLLARSRFVIEGTGDSAEQAAQFASVWHERVGAVR